MKTTDRRNTALIMAAAWTGLNTLSALVLFFSKIQSDTALGALIALLISAGNLYVANVFLRNDTRTWYSGARKWFGYAAAAAYCALAIPLANIREAGGMALGLASFIFVLIALSTLVATALWIYLYIPSSRVWWGFISAEEAKNPKLLKQRKRKEKLPLHAHILGWVDSFAWAIIAVIIIQRLFFQLYVIPSESMVPAFLVGDRPVILKVADAPSFPFAPKAFPRIANIERGKIVVFDNPELEPRTPFQNFLQEAVFYLTFSKVNLDREADGSLRVSRLVKRVAGIPGEQLMMVDDVLYHRQSLSEDWQILSADSEWARPDLKVLSRETLAKVNVIPISAQQRSFLERWDARKNSLQTEELKSEIGILHEKLLQAFAKRDRDRDRNSNSQAEVEVLGFSQSAAELRLSRMQQSMGSEAIPVWKLAADADLDKTLSTVFLADSSVREAWLSWLIDNPLAEVSNPGFAQGRNLSLYAKQTQAERILNLVQAVNGDTMAMQRYDAAYRSGMEFKAWLSVYDARNFPPYPSNGLIPEKHWFLLGDNRLNSVDCRFDAYQRFTPQAFDNTATDGSSAYRMSMLGLRLVPESYILGRSLFKLFSTNAVRTTR